MSVPLFNDRSARAEHGAGRILITGATGWLGGEMSRRLAAAGFSVFAVARDAEALERSGLASIPGATPVVCDLATTVDGLPAAYDWLLHLAAHAPPRPQTADACLTGNLLSTRSAIRHAIGAGARGALFTSTLSIFGDISVEEVDPTTPSINPGVYGVSKRMAEALFAEAAAELPTLSMRLPGIVGPGAITPWLGMTIERLASGLPVTLYNPEHPFNNAVHVADLTALIQGVTSVGLTGYDMITLGAAGPQPLMTVIGAAAGAIGQRAVVEVKPAARVSFTISSQRAVERYGYAPMEILPMAGRYAQELCK